ncbi:hypothetical protein [Photobacterium leiognathi]|uniref:hypothetical protein n=1 Tax=Photobacterium leiognathi TaxID=553611 RepID=UPI002982AC7B|nr:hypothetical protein [Photobacterium leiognathi]
MKSSKSSVVIDGRSFSGRSIEINGNKVVVDGVTQEGELVGDISITVNGDVDSLQTGSGDVKAGDVKEIRTGSGGVTCGHVSGSIQTGAGNVECGSVSGSILTMLGDIYHR